MPSFVAWLRTTAEVLDFVQEVLISARPATKIKTALEFFSLISYDAKTLFSILTDTRLTGEDFVQFYVLLQEKDFSLTYKVAYLNEIITGLAQHPPISLTRSQNFIEVLRSLSKEAAVLRPLLNQDDLFPTLEIPHMGIRKSIAILLYTFVSHEHFQRVFPSTYPKILLDFVIAQYGLKDDADICF